MMLRRIARPMLAAWFVTEGSAAVRGAPAHLEPARAGVDALAEQAGFTRPTDPQLRTIVQVHGGLTIAAGAALALGKAPRLAAVLLAALTFPSVVANLVASRRGTTSAAAKAERQERAVRALSFTGAALIAAADREGRPGLAWKLSHAKQLAAAGAATGVAGLGKSGGKAGAKAAKASAAGGAKAAATAKKAEAKAVKGAAKAAKASATGGAEAVKGAVKEEATAGRLAGKAAARSARATERADARAVKVAAAQAVEAAKAAKVAERAQAATQKVSRAARRADVKAAKRAARDTRDVVAA